MQNMKPLRLSIIVPVYNAAGLLRTCLQSLTHQTLQDLEIICVDDGSTDASLAVLQEHAAKDTRIKVIHQANAGVSVARNRGLDAATGEYVTFVDADDWVEPVAYEMALSAFHQEVDMVCFGVVVDGECEPGLEGYCNNFPDGETDVTPQRIAGMNASIWNKIYRYRVIQEQGLRFHEGLAYGEDEAFFFSYAAVMQGAISGVPHRGYHYVQHAASAMSNPTIGSRLPVDLLCGFDYMHDFYSVRGMLPRMMPVLDRILQGVYMQTMKYSEDGKTLMTKMIRAAKKSRLLHFSHSHYMQELRGQNIPLWASPFHWITGTKESYGIFRKSIISVSREPDCRIYRCLGYCIKRVREVWPS